MFKRIAVEFIHVQAERRFKEVVTQITQGLTVADLRRLAENNIPLSRVLQESGYKMERPKELHPGAQYLLDLPDQSILELIEAAAPEHVKVLRQYPEFAITVMDAFRKLVTDH